MGTVIEKNVVLTAGHVVYESDCRSLPADFIFSDVSVRFYPNFHSGVHAKVVGFDCARDLARLSLETGDIEPVSMADGVVLGQRVHWYYVFTRIAGSSSPFDFAVETFRGRVIEKIHYVDRDEIRLCESNACGNKSAVRGIEKLVLIISGCTHPGSSGGPVLNDDDELVGVVNFHDCFPRAKTGAVSVDGARRFLDQNTSPPK